MPQILKTALEIAKDVGHPILLVDFQRPKDRDGFFPKGDWDHAARKRFVTWLGENPTVPWVKCFPPLGEGYILYPYTGMIAIPVCETSHPDIYKEIVHQWEHPDLTPNVENIRLFIMNPPKEVDDEIA